MAFHLSWVCVILCCVFASLAGVSNVSNDYPPLWSKTPSQFSDYSVENGKYIINPWNYLERMGMYKILLHQTAKYFEKFAPGNGQNILWGLPLQHGWQYQTDFNYYLSAIPFLAAVDSGIMGILSDNVLLLPPPKDQMNFCYNVSSCHSSFPEVMRMWNEFYQHVKSPSANLDELLKHLWDAHVSSIEAAHRNFHCRLKYYSKQEADFQRSWALFVNYLAQSFFPATYIRICEFQKGLPPRILITGDRAPFISDFTDFQNIVLLALEFFHKMHKYTGTLSLAAWKILMKFKVARKLFLEILEISIHLFN